MREIFCVLFFYVYVFIFMYVYMCLFVWAWFCMCVFLSMRAFIFVWTCVFLRVYACFCVCVSVCQCFRHITVFFGNVVCSIFMGSLIFIALCQSHLCIANNHTGVYLNTGMKKKSDDFYFKSRCHHKQNFHF